MLYLLDTSVYSQPLRNEPVESALLRWKSAGDAACCVSVVSIAEVEWGLHHEGQARRVKRYRDLLLDRLPTVQTTEDIWRQFAFLKARQQRLGAPVADLDLLIAATAQRHRLIVATLNIRDFARIEGVAWEDWSVLS